MQPELQPSPAYLPLSVPLESLAGHCRDAGEVVVAVQEGEPLQLGRRGDDEIHRTRTAMLSLFGESFLDLPGAVVGAVVDGNPTEDQPHVLDAARTVGGRPGAVEELKLGDRAGGDEPGGCRLVPAVLLRVLAHEPSERAGVDQELGRVHRR
ncbi:hypothetical protein QFZ67_004033 [Streptomyces sp. V1I1]|nr:hypothetical protein [Streptomyces sp. V1I1]